LHDRKLFSSAQTWYRRWLAGCRSVAARWSLRLHTPSFLCRASNLHPPNLYLIHDSGNYQQEKYSPPNVPRIAVASLRTHRPPIRSHHMSAQRPLHVSTRMWLAVSYKDSQRGQGPGASYWWMKRGSGTSHGFTEPMQWIRAEGIS
jgi:hypothetical protein